MTDGATGVLIVGYGNALRSDDGLGWHAAARLAEDPRLAGANVIGCHQLTPELALDVSRSSFVVFVDASRDPPGALAVEPVEAAPDSTVTWTHHVDPAVLLALARDLYGRAPDGAAVSVGVASVEAGERLSRAVAGVLDEVVEVVVRLATGRAAVAPARAAGHA